MKEGMLASQLATLEEPDDAVVIEVNGTIEDNLQQIRQKLGR
jgi:gluconate kinase